MAQPHLQLLPPVGLLDQLASKQTFSEHLLPKDPVLGPGGFTGDRRACPWAFIPREGDRLVKDGHDCPQRMLGEGWAGLFGEQTLLQYRNQPCLAHDSQGTRDVPAHPHGLT